jgi:DNA glycosylase AlkZ-like
MTVALDDDTIRRLRLANQQLVAPELVDPAAVVSHLVAMQAQEYAMAKWAIGLRLADGGSDEAVESACDEGRILRLHALRPTWHFVAAEDIRMVLQVTAKRVHQANAFLYRSLDLDAARLEGFVDVVRGLLAGGNHLTRKEIRGGLGGRQGHPHGLPAHVRGARRGGLQRAAARQPVHLRAARRARRADPGAVA